MPNAPGPSRSQANVRCVTVAGTFHSRFQFASSRKPRNALRSNLDGGTVFWVSQASRFSVEYGKCSKTGEGHAISPRQSRLNPIQARIQSTRRLSACKAGIRSHFPNQIFSIHEAPTPAKNIKTKSRSQWICRNCRSKVEQLHMPGDRGASVTIQCAAVCGYESHAATSDYFSLLCAVAGMPD